MAKRLSKSVWMLIIFILFFIVVVGSFWYYTRQVAYFEGTF